MQIAVQPMQNDYHYQSILSNIHNHTTQLERLMEDHLHNINPQLEQRLTRNTSSIKSIIEKHERALAHSTHPIINLF